MIANGFSLKVETFARRTFLWPLVKRLRHEVTVGTDHGLFTFKTNDLSIGRSLFRVRRYQYQTLLTVMSLIDHYSPQKSGQPTYLIDIGANIGTTCIALLCQKYFDRGLAFEPDAENFGYLTRNIKQNALSERLSAFQWAISSENAILQWERSDDNCGDHRIRVESAAPQAVELLHESKRSVTTVECKPLDNVLNSLGVDAKQVRLIWMRWIDC